MKTTVTTFEQSIKLKDIGLDQYQGASVYVAENIVGKPDNETKPVAAAYTLEQLLYVASAFVGNHGFPAQVRSIVTRKPSERNPERIIQYLYVYNGTSFVTEGETPIGIICDLLYKLRTKYHVEEDRMNKNLIAFNKTS